MEHKREEEIQRLKSINLLFNQVLLQNIIKNFLDNFEDIENAREFLEDNIEGLLDRIDELSKKELDNENNTEVQNFLNSYKMEVNDE